MIKRGMYERHVAEAVCDYINRMMRIPEKAKVERCTDETASKLNFYCINLGTQIKEYRITVEKVDNAMTDFYWGYMAAKGKPYGKP